MDPKTSGPSSHGDAGPAGSECSLFVTSVASTDGTTWPAAEPEARVTWRFRGPHAPFPSDPFPHDEDLAP